jgi:CRISPR-associated protein Cas1
VIELLNVLYVQMPGAFVRLDHDAVAVDVDGELKLRVPLIRLASIVVFGRVVVSPAIIERCALDGRGVVWLDGRGRFVGRVEGPTRGNVLLRRAQHLALDDASRTLEIARRSVAAKIQNARHSLLRAAREPGDASEARLIAAAAEHLGRAIDRVATVGHLDELRGLEGDAARVYFGVFGLLVRTDRSAFPFDTRTRRPPRDRTNALISFLYALVLAECSSALEGVGLDPQVGYLHMRFARGDRPSRSTCSRSSGPSWPIDSRCGSSTVASYRRRTSRTSPAVASFLRNRGGGPSCGHSRKRKAEEIPHRVLGRPIPVGLLPHVQARLLARHLRGDLPAYPAFRAR